MRFIMSRRERIVVPTLKTEEVDPHMAIYTEQVNEVQRSDTVVVTEKDSYWYDPMFRFRNVYTVFGGTLVIILMILTDPSTGFITDMKYGASVLAYLVSVLLVVLLVGLMHISRKALLDYIDLEKIVQDAVNNKQSGLVVIAVSLITMSVSLIISSVVIATSFIGR